MSLFEVMGGPQSSNKYEYLRFGCLFSGMQAFSWLWKAHRAQINTYTSDVCAFSEVYEWVDRKGEGFPLRGSVGMIPLKVLNVTSRRSRKPPAGNPDSLIYDTRGVLDPPEHLPRGKYRIINSQL